jgi:uncharacterized protein YggU (UPF0235/DUF167 family)
VGACLSVSVVPNARRSEVCGLHDGTLRIRLAAPPVDGRVNGALRDWLAQELALPRHAVLRHSGHSRRHKKLIVHAHVVKLRVWMQPRLASGRG